MGRESKCRCLICDLERNLALAVASDDFTKRYSRFVCSHPLLLPFPVPTDLVDFLHTRTTIDDILLSDVVLSELLQSLGADGDSTLRDLLLFAFIPMLHSISRKVASRYASLAVEDISQHAVLSLLETVGSRQFYERRSHIAFAISRSLKRQMFEWAARGTRQTVSSDFESEIPNLQVVQDTVEPFERAVLLRHFLYRCQQRGLLTSDELELLIQFKLNATREGNTGGPAAVYSNASRQRMKRLLAKLRRIARTI